MLIDELREQLKTAEPHLTAIQTYVTNSKLLERFEALDKQVAGENFWQDPKRDEILVEHRKLKPLVEEYKAVMQSYQDSLEIIELFSDNEEELAKIKSDIYALCKKINKVKIELLLNKPEDTHNCYLTINSGAGGTESQDWASMLLRMYLRFCEREDFKVDVLDFQ